MIKITRHSCAFAALCMYYSVDATAVVLFSYSGIKMLKPIRLLLIFATHVSCWFIGYL